MDAGAVERGFRIRLRIGRRGVAGVGETIVGGLARRRNPHEAISGDRSHSDATGESPDDAEHPPAIIAHRGGRRQVGRPCYALANPLDRHVAFETALLLGHFPWRGWFASSWHRRRPALWRAGAPRPRFAGPVATGRQFRSGAYFNRPDCSGSRSRVLMSPLQRYALRYIHSQAQNRSPSARRLITSRTSTQATNPQPQWRGSRAYTFGFDGSSAVYRALHVASSLVRLVSMIPEWVVRTFDRNVIIYRNRLGNFAAFTRTR
jgi:hypothetical protein